MSTPSVVPSFQLGPDIHTLAAFPDLDRLIASLETTWQSPPSLTPVDGRGGRRLDAAQLTCSLRVMIPGAAHNQVVNVSSSGILIATPHRLCPGRVVDIFIRCDGERRTLRATIVRSRVHAIRPDIVYRTALRFETPLELPETGL